MACSSKYGFYNRIQCNLQSGTARIVSDTRMEDDITTRMESVGAMRMKRYFDDRGDDIKKRSRQKQC